MAKTTRKTESVPAEPVKKTAPGRKKAADPASGAEKVTTRRVKKTAPAAGAASASAVAPAIEPTHDEIALRAWSIYERRGRSHGQAMSDWLQAKAELCRERGLKP